jgi:sugar phosphate isomerase/epimerase
MKIGASIWPFRWDKPYEDAIRRIAQLGFKAIELIAWDREALDTYYTPQEIKKLRDIIASEGLELSEFVSTPPGMASREQQDRDAAVEHFKRMVEVAVGLGTKTVNTVSVFPFAIEVPRITDRPHMQEFSVDYPSGLNWQQNWEDYVDAVRRCCDICEDAQVRYALEPHPYRYMSNAASMLRLIEHVKSDALGMNFDPSHLFPMGDMPHTVIYQLGDRIFHCHFSDNDGTTNVHWRPGKGKIDWTAVMRALQETGFDGTISIELEDVPGVARGQAEAPGVYKGNWDATDAFEEENRKAMAYIKGIAANLGVAIVP